MGTMSILGRKGDVKVEWNPDNKKEVEVAESAFKENKKRGFSAFRVYDDWRKGEQLRAFDAKAEKIIFVPPLAGG